MGTYCQPSDLEVGNLMLTDDDQTKAPYIEQAEDEMNGKLGWLYEVPIDVEALRYHERMLLKTICRKLALGRMVTTLAIPEEGGSLHAYGRTMLREGSDELNMLANGEVPLTAKRADYDSEDPDSDPSGIGARGSRTPEITNADSESLFMAFNKTVYGNQPWFAVPDDQVGL